MPFGFGRKQDEAAVVPDARPESLSTTTRLIAFQGFTEDWRLEGQVVLTGRLLEVLNQREPIAVTDVRWAPIDGHGTLAPAEGIGELDPYDLVVVIAGSGTLAATTDDERAAHRIHKVSFDVAVTAPPFRVVGSVQVHPGAVPESIMDRGGALFAALTNAAVHHGDEAIELGGASTVLVNRAYIREVVQVDLSTGLPYANLPRLGQSR
ncbi:MAG: hypothetical protein ABI573_00340 [Chloroflexota bacterium]